MNNYEFYESLARIREPLIEKIIQTLDIDAASKGVDIGCGIGRITDFLSYKTGLNQELIGLDYSDDVIEYAKNTSTQKSIRFIQGDINSLNLNPNSFDWIWSMDTVWAGPKEYECPAKKPDAMLNQLYKILRPGGKIYLAFWSSQKILPGHPLLEARLNASMSANAPYLENMNPDTHVLYGQKWLKKAQFKDIKAESFAGSFVGPLSDDDKTCIANIFQMFWGSSEKEVSKEDWDKFNLYCSPESDKFILNDPDYYGYYVYTLFTGTKE